MGMSKVYRGYVIEDINGQYYIHNAPNFTNGVPFSPGPHGGWTVATHQVDILINHMNRGQNTNNARWTPYESSNDNYSSSSSDSGYNPFVKFEDTLNREDRETFLEIKADYHNLSDEEFKEKWNRSKEYAVENWPAILTFFESIVYNISKFVTTIIAYMLMGLAFVTVLKVIGWLFY